MKANMAQHTTASAISLMLISFSKFLCCHLLCPGSVGNQFLALGRVALGLAHAPVADQWQAQLANHAEHDEDKQPVHVRSA